MSVHASPWRPEFIAALLLLARLSEAMAARGLPRPVPVGGGAVEFYPGSALMTGDIDVTSPVQPELEELRRLGFDRPSGAGKFTGEWVHPGLGLGFQVVASTPMGGFADSSRIRLIEQSAGRFRVLSVEDVIADRMGQYASGSAPDMLDQARKLLALYPTIDRDYLEVRVRAEQQAIMASKTSMADEGQPIDMVEFGRDLLRRRAEYEAKNGPLVIARNDGSRRTPAKRALLAEIEKLAAAKGFRW
ncbi:MAG: hypothetical protein WDN24_21955 [Sphingomonas sp.]